MGCKFYCCLRWEVYYTKRTTELHKQAGQLFEMEAGQLFEMEAGQ